MGGGGGGRADGTGDGAINSLVDSATEGAGDSPVYVATEGAGDSPVYVATDSPGNQSSVGSLLGSPGPELAAAVKAAIDPACGLVPAGFLPVGGSTDPWAQVIHAVVASRRLQGWLLWGQLSLLARWTAAWRARPPVSNTLDEPDRCESSDPDLAARVNWELTRIERQFGGRLAPLWGGDPTLPVQLVASLVAAELGLASGLSRTVSEQHVDAAEALFTRGRLPRVERLLRAGWVDWPKVQVFVHATDALDPVVAHAVERIVIGDASDNADPTDAAGGVAGGVDVLLDPSRPGLGLPVISRMTLPQLRAAIDAAVAAIDAEAAARRARQARSARRVRSRATGDGTATLTADVTVEAAAAVWNALTAAAKAARAAGDPRCLDQLRADILVARATTTPLAPPMPADTWDASVDTNPNGENDEDPGEFLGDIHASGDPRDLHHPVVAQAATAQAAAQSAPTEPPHRPDPADPAVPDHAGVACHACGQWPGQARAQRAGAPLTVNLTLPLSAYLEFSQDPGHLDGYGPVAAGLARQIIRDTARGHTGGLTGMTWRCVVTDDTHGTVLGVGSPIHVPRHDPPPRLADLVRTTEPTCCFPGCRTRARDCDLDHRIPYAPGDPDRGATCSCNLGALCRTHHRLKTAGLIGIRVVPDDEAVATPGVQPGTLEFTTSTGLRYLRAPHRATPAPPDLDDPLIATALAHAALQCAQDAVHEARLDHHHAAIHRRQADHTRGVGVEPGDGHGADTYDGEDTAWSASLEAHPTTHRYTAQS